MIEIKRHWNNLDQATRYRLGLAGAAIIIALLAAARHANPPEYPINAVPEATGTPVTPSTEAGKDLNKAQRLRAEVLFTSQGAYPIYNDGPERNSLLVLPTATPR